MCMYVCVFFFFFAAEGRTLATVVAEGLRGARARPCVWSNYDGSSGKGLQALGWDIGPH